MLTLSEVLAYLTGAHRMTEPELINTFGPEVQEAVGHLKMLGLVEKVAKAAAAPAAKPEAKK